MKVAFVSNYLNHHQKAFCEALQKKCTFLGFIETDPEDQGYQSRMRTEYVFSYRRNKKECEEMIINADMVIFGACPNELIFLRMKFDKLSFLFSERFFKKGTWRRFIPTTKNKINQRILQFNNKKIYLLCASAYLPYDIAFFKEFKNECYRWGYFPEVKHYADCAQMMEKKKTASILWAGRLIEWKHPEYCIYIAKKLKRAGYAFQFNIVGDGKLKTKIEQEIEKKGLTDCVHMLGAMKPEEVRRHMEESRIFLFTSDFREGWGAVLNESMNSGCAVVASHAIGSVPFLIQDKENGLIYKNGDLRDFYSKVKYLLDHPDRAREFGANAYKTITEKWNAENAAERVIRLSEALLTGEKNPSLYNEGPCSRAAIIKNGWYR